MIMWYVRVSCCSCDWPKSK